MDAWISKYRKNGLIVDTNLYLLWCAGLIDSSKIQQMKRVDQFTSSDYKILIHVVRQFDRIVVTPSILTEVSNLLKHVHTRALEVFQKRIFLAKPPEEVHLPSERLIVRKEFLTLGLADQGIEELATERDLAVLTVDFKLAARINQKGMRSQNFRHVIDWYANS